MDAMEGNRDGLIDAPIPELPESRTAFLDCERKNFLDEAIVVFVTGSGTLSKSSNYKNFVEGTAQGLGLSVTPQANEGTGLHFDPPRVRRLRKSPALKACAHRSTSLSSLFASGANRLGLCYFTPGAHRRAFSRRDVTMRPRRSVRSENTSWPLRP